MIDLEFCDYLNFFYPKAGKFKVDRKRLPSFLNLVASHASTFAPTNQTAKNFDYSLIGFRRFWTGYKGRKVVASLNSYKNMPIHSEHKSAPSLSASVRCKLGPNVGNALISVTEISNPDKKSDVDVNAYSRNRHPPENNGKGKRRRVVFPADNSNISGSLPNWLPIEKNPRFEGDPKKRNCTENRILNGLHANMGGVKLAGKIIMYTDRVPCSSCRTVISKFLKFHQDIKMEVIYAYPKEWWEGEYLEVGTLLKLGVNVTLVRKVGVNEKEVFWPDFWLYG